ncbi:MAG: BMP family ABC transporter substrate-binding protein [Spirochaetales bacterium]|nr:BMP family ABC transporter substrate-binding protein [Spirochaetales bacterium]
MKKLTVVLLIALVAMTAIFASGSPEASSDSKATKVGFVVINDENDLGYTWNFMNGMTAAVEKLNADGYNVELIVDRGHLEDSTVTDANRELAAQGCAVVFNNSYGFEQFMAPVADEFPEVQFVSLTNCGSQLDGRDNTYNAFAAIYDGRYVAGIVAGMKLNQLIAEGKITADQAIVGYVGAYSFAEVISGMSGYFLGIRSVCPSAKMIVQFVGSWGDPTLEASAAEALIQKGAVMISQHSDTTTPATTAAKYGVFHTGYNTDMTSQAPTASLLSCRINWEPYFYTFIKNVIEGVKNPSDYCGTMANDEVLLTELNTAIAAPGTQEAIDAAIADLTSGKIQVFDTSKFTIGGQTLTSMLAVDSDGDFAADKCEAVWDGVFHESYPEFQSAPYFTGVIDGIEWLNAAY